MAIAAKDEFHKFLNDHPDNFVWLYRTMEMNCEECTVGVDFSKGKDHTVLIEMAKNDKGEWVLGLIREI
jgi:FAD synthase